jgi:Zn finger protein HypA/HybF involved in hydrogenase expression
MEYRCIPQSSQAAARQWTEVDTRKPRAETGHAMQMTLTRLVHPLALFANKELANKASYSCGTIKFHIECAPPGEYEQQDRTARYCSNCDVKEAR